MNLVLIGARHDGQAHVLVDAIEERGEHHIVAFADETQKLRGTSVLGIPVIGAPSELHHFLKHLDIKGAAVAIGNCQARDRLSKICVDIGLALPPIIHPAAHVSRHAKIGQGVFVGQGVQILAGAVIEDLALINAATVISHHVHIGRATVIGPNSTLAGRSKLDSFVFIGAGATVLPDVSIGRNSVLGAGAVAVSDLPEGVTAAGVPAKPLLRRT